MLSVKAMRGVCIPVWIVWLGLWAAPLVFGQAARQDGVGTHGRKTIRATPLEQPILLDGKLDEAAWATAPVSLGFIQRDPQEGQPSTEKTEFRVLYTPSTLYLGIICYDDDAAGILARERRRDNSLENDDIVSVLFDTFHDHRNSFLFRTNPLGTQYDSLITDEGRNTNPNWDEKWDVATTINEAGWIAEFAVPFKSLRVQDTDDGQTWGLDVERVIRRKNEFSYWNNFRRGFSLENGSQAGHLQGLEEIETGLRLRVKPYSLGGFSQTSDKSNSAVCRDRNENKPPPVSDTCNASDIGIEVIKYRLTPSLTMDLTANTDFAQTEVDNQQVNL
ncbi:MAG: carbohydrate binding family 9 domain-containing protein, partial [Acidobacteria bacterium]|nr:carbohydrate binding family 9 domain-containing protein [Acidobacteriota bacterium]